MNNIKSKSLIVIMFLITLMILTFRFTVYADESEPFQLVESNPANQSTEVDLNPEIKLLFNKNVVNFSVKENNLKCINMYNEKNEAVAVELIFPDDQIEPEKKREIYIRTVEGLNEAMKYIIEISADMMAKNGSTLGQNTYITFTTISEADPTEQIEKVEQLESQNTLELQITKEATVTSKENQVIAIEEADEFNESNESYNSNIDIPETNKNQSKAELSENEEKANTEEIIEVNASQVKNDVENLESEDSEKINEVMGKSTISIIIVAIASVFIGSAIYIKFKKRRR